MKIFAIGAGSIGMRHLRNIRSLGAEVAAFDTDPARRDVLLKEMGIRSPARLEDVCWGDFDAVCVCTPSHLHYAQIRELFRRDVALFVEKPLALDGREAGELALAARGKVTMVGCNMRFHPAVKVARETLDLRKLGKVFSFRAYCGHYLPNWRPWLDYRNSYSARADEGGGIIFDSIHELDYAADFFGFPESVYALAGKVSDLETDADDLAEILYEAGGVKVSIHLDCLQHVKRRGYEIVGENGALLWASVGNRDEVADVKFLGKDCADESISLAVDLNAPYIEEMRLFLDAVEKGSNAVSTFGNAARVVALAEAARASAASGRREELKVS